MATGNFLLGTVRKKLGDIVFYRTDGEQRARARIRKIKNPRSQAQQIQRSIMATVTQAYSAMSAIVDHSFESVQYGQRSMYYFNKINADELRALYANDINEGNSGVDAKARVTAPKVSALIANPYIVSKGSLTSPFTFAVTNTTENQKITIFPAFDITAGKSTIEYIAKNLNIFNVNSVMTILKFKLNENILYTYGDDPTSPGASIPTLSFEYERIVRNTLPIADEDAKKIVGSETGQMSLADFFAKYFDADKSSAAFETIISDIITVGNKGKDYTKEDFVAVAIISSEKVVNTWKRSNEKLTMMPLPELGLDANYGMLAWSQGVTEIGENEWYLNKGEY